MTEAPRSATLKTVGEFVELGVKLGVLVGAAFGVWQYLEAKQQSRVARTSEYIDRFEDGQAGSSARRINAALRPYQDQFASLSTGGFSVEDRTEVVLTIVEEANGGALADDLDAFIDFYEGLDTCVQSSLCDAQVADRYFSPRAKEFWANFEPYITYRRANNPSFARGLENYKRPHRG